VAKVTTTGFSLWLPERVMTNLPVAVLPFLAGSGTEMLLIVMFGGASMLLMVPVAVARAILLPLPAAERWTVMVLAEAKMVSSMVLTVMFWVVSPMLKVRVPLFLMKFLLNLAVLAAVLNLRVMGAVAGASRVTGKVRMPPSLAAASAMLTTERSCLASSASKATEAVLANA